MKTIGLIAIVVAANLLNTLPSFSREPDYPCYIRTAKRQIIDLSAMCRGLDTASTVTSVSSVSPQITVTTNSRDPRLEFAGIYVKKLQYNATASGTIRNKSSESVTIDFVTGVINGKTMQIIANTTIEPGQTQSFSDAVVRGSATDGTLSVLSWTDLEGETHRRNFASCDFVSNIESEKFCKSR